MQTASPIDDMLINAFVDGQLDADAQQTLIEAMESDPEVRERVQMMRRAKDLFRVGFSDAESPSSEARATPRAAHSEVRRHRRPPRAVAALLLLGVALGGGLVGYSIDRHTSANTLTAALASAQKATTDHVILHIGQSDPQQFSAALHYVEYFLEHNPGTESRLEVIANSGGLDLMRADKSPFRDRVVALLREHRNVHFIACANGIRNLRKRGITPLFPKEVETDKTAIDHIVNRLRAGWTYVKVDNLPEI